MLANLNHTWTIGVCDSEDCAEVKVMSEYKILVFFRPSGN